MPTALDAPALVGRLPGTWRVRATTTPVWLAGDRIDPTYTWQKVGDEPPRLSVDVSFTTPEGETRHVLGSAAWRGAVFVWRAKGIWRLVPSRWIVTGLEERDDVLVLRSAKSLAAPGGIDVLESASTDHGDTRAVIAGASADYGLSAEEFASLTWLG